MAGDHLSSQEEVPGAAQPRWTLLKVNFILHPLPSPPKLVVPIEFMILTVGAQIATSRTVDVWSLAYKERRCEILVLLTLFISLQNETEKGFLFCF